MPTSAIWLQRDLGVVLHVGLGICWAAVTLRHHRSSAAALAATGVLLLLSVAPMSTRLLHVGVATWGVCVVGLGMRDAARWWVAAPVAVVAALGSWTSMTTKPATIERWPTTLSMTTLAPTHAQGYASSTLTPAAATAFVDEGRCRACHVEQVNAHHRSAHRQASLHNVVYLRALRRDLLKNGRHQMTFCMGCHDHGVLAAGRIDDVEALLVRDDWQQALPAFIDDLEHSLPGSSAGLTCLSCHGGASLQANHGNGAWQLQASPDPLLSSSTWRATLASWTTKVDARSHRRHMRTSETGSSHRCGACHQSFLHEGIVGVPFAPGQQEQQHHRRSTAFAHSGLASFVVDSGASDDVSCAQCHMQDARGGHEMATANSFLPADARRHDDLERLRQHSRTQGDLQFAFFAVHDDDVVKLPRNRLRRRCGNDVEACVANVHLVVSNEGIPHAAFGGTQDLTDAWFSFAVVDDKGDVRRQEGSATSPTSGVHRLSTQMLDDDGHVERGHQLSNLHTPLTTRPLRMGDADVVRLQFTWPQDVDEVTLRARLHTRKMAPLDDVDVSQALPVQLRLDTATDVVLDDEHAYARYAVAVGNAWDDVRAEQALRHLPLADVGVVGKLAHAHHALQRTHAYLPLADLLDGEAHPQLQFRRAQALVRGGRAPDALALLTTLSEAYDADRDVWWTRSVAERRSGHTADAVRSVERALALDPFFFAGWQALSAMEGELRHGGRARWARRQAEQVRPSRERTSIAVQRQLQDANAAREADRVHVHVLRPAKKNAP
mgnify:CR=1 FL=1